jgi:hypothetical protein
VQLLAVRICTPFQRSVKFNAQLFANLHFSLKHRLKLLRDINPLTFQKLHLPHHHLKLIFKPVVRLCITNYRKHLRHDFKFYFDLPHPISQFVAHLVTRLDQGLHRVYVRSPHQRVLA